MSKKQVDDWDKEYPVINGTNLPQGTPFRVAEVIAEKIRQELLKGNIGDHE